MYNFNKFKYIFIIFGTILYNFYRNTLLNTYKIYPENLRIAKYCWRNYVVIENAAFGRR